MAIEEGNWVEVTVVPNRPKIPMLVTHVHDERTVSGVAFTGERMGLGWRSPCMDYQRIQRGPLPRQWMPYPKGKGPGAVKVAKAEDAGGMSEDAIKAVVVAAMSAYAETLKGEISKLVAEAVEISIGAQIGSAVESAVLKVVKDLPPPPPAAPPEGESSAEAGASDAEIADAIGKLEEGNKEHFTAGGNGPPRVEAIEEVLGKDISSAQRDRVWESINR